MSDTATAPTIVIGLGNPLMTDDGVGLAALDKLTNEWQFVPPVELVDGGTWGLNLLPVIETAGRLLLLDAIDVNSPPGSLVTLAREELPRLLQIKVSPHQIAVSEVIALAELRGTLPADTVALGLQPDRIELATELSAVCESALHDLVDAAVEQLEAWGHWALPVVRCAAGNCRSITVTACACSNTAASCCSTSTGTCACMN